MPQQPTTGLDPLVTGERSQWWRRAVGYQIYPRSFADSNGDGSGDLRGIIDRLDYLAWLGIDFIWLSPVYASPQKDNGYDISDYQAIDPIYGTMADFDELVDQAHARNIRLVMDIVVNHTSDQHPWFLQSRSSKDNPKREWYWWRQHPNNWESRFSGSAWEHDAATDEYYLHLFATQQPDLNWENTEVRQAVYAMMRWWLTKGIDGFRMDVINLISKDPALPDGAPIRETTFGNGRPFYTNGPRLHEFLAELHREVIDQTDRALITIGETPQASVRDGQLFTDPARHELDMVFQFEHVNVDYGSGRWDPIPLSLPALKRSLARWQEGLAEHGWNSLYFNNHDQPRVVSRWGDPAFPAQSAKAWATVLHLHRGTPFVYQGEELGMTNYEIRSVDDIVDVQSRNYFQTAVASGDDPDVVLDRIRARARDHARTPMQWSDDVNAGFSTGRPWMPVNPNYHQINVEHEAHQEDSVLAWYRRLIELRHTNEVVALGDCQVLDLDDPELYVIRRQLGNRVVTMVANLSRSTRSVSEWIPDSARVLLDTHAGADGDASDASDISLADHTDERDLPGSAANPPTDTDGVLKEWQAIIVESEVAA